MCEAHPVCSGTDPDPAEHTPADADGRTRKKKLNVYLYLFIFFTAFFTFRLDVIPTSYYNKIVQTVYYIGMLVLISDIAICILSPVCQQSLTPGCPSAV